MCCVLFHSKRINLTGNQDENWLDIYRNKLVRRLRGMHHNNLDCVHDLAVDNMDVVAFYELVGTIHDCPAVELMPVSTENRIRIKRAKYFINLEPI